MKRKLLMLLTCLLFGIGLMNAQTQTVTGLVIAEEDGEPVVGASVVVKDTNLGTITDIDGNFSLPNVPTSAKTLQVSFIGMQTAEVAIKPTVKVIMKSDSELLDEVMIVAYGTAKKSAFTGSASVVKSDDIGKIQTSNAVNALTGKVAGVQMSSSSGQPGTTTPAIRIRGVSSINAGNAPLIVLDGMPFDGDLNNINSQDIESMTVLKDAASNALYGSRGANGVIIITTKKGATGTAKVTVDAKLGVNKRATQDYKMIEDPRQYYEMHHSALKNYFVNTQGLDAGRAHLMANQNLTANNDYGLGYNAFTTPNGQYLIGENGKFNPNATLGRTISYGGQEYLVTPDNWLDEAYKSSFRQEYNVTISAGADKSTFYASFNYLNNEGITANSDYERLVGRLKADYQVKDWLKVGGNMAFTHYKLNSMNDDGASASSGNVFAIATQIAPIYPLYIRDGQGKVMYDSNGIKMYDYGNGENAGLIRPVFSTANALSDAILNTNSANGNAFNSTGFAEIRFLENLKLTLTSNANVDETRSTSVTNPYYGGYASSNGIVNKYHTRSYSFNHQQLLNYFKEFGLHNVGVLLGHEYYRYKFSYLSGSKSNMFDPNNNELAGAVIDGSQDSFTSDYNTEGYFFRGQYDYDEKYYASASYRRDASSRFHPDNRWGNFWSMGLAWNLSKESWFNVEWIDMLKFKASYGSQGNDNIGNYRYTDTYNIVNSGGNAAAIPATMGNKDITWETNGNFNTGFDFELLKGRVSGTLEYFYRKTTDMLFSFPLPPSYGYTSYYANVGDMRNKGVELELRATPVKTKDLTWDVNFNITSYKNKITKLPAERKTMTTSEGISGYTSGLLFFGEGIPLYTLNMPKYAGVNEEGESLFYVDQITENGVERVKTSNYSDAGSYLCGTTLPDAYGGFGTSLTYKGFDFSIDFVYQIGGQVYDGDYAAAMSSPSKEGRGTAFHADLLKSWTPEKQTKTPRMQYGDLYSSATSDRFITDASYLSLQNINAGYTLPGKTCRMMGLEAMRLYVACDNVWLWSKRQGLDPRQSISGSSTSSFYAPIRTISGGLTVTF